MTSTVSSPTSLPATARADIARSFFACLSTKDIDALAALWHPDAVLSVPYPADGFPTELRGKDEIVTAFRGLLGNFATFAAHLSGVYPAADSDAVTVEYRNVAVLVGGTEYTNDNIAVFRFSGGLICEYHDYFDPRRFQVVVDALPRG